MRELSLTASPIHLITLLTLEVTAEKSLGEKHGLAGIVGAGYPGVFIGELGMSYRYYVLGNFDKGMQIGAEGLMGFADGVTVLQPSLFLGGKCTAGGGFTLDGQAGGSWLDGGPALMLNFNLGWSFG